MKERSNQEAPHPHGVQMVLVEDTSFVAQAHYMQHVSEVVVGIEDILGIEEHGAEIVAKIAVIDIINIVDYLR